MKITRIKGKFMGGILLMLVTVLCYGGVVSAANFAVSPMNQEVILTPGQEFYGSFEIVNPATSENDMDYVVSIGPYDVDEENTVLLQDKGDYSQIVEWITIFNEEGTIAPNSTETVHFMIDVPEDAPAGGQYAAIMVRSKVPDDAEAGSLTIKQNIQVAHLIYAEVMGETVQDVTVSDLQMPTVLFGGNLIGTVVMKNNGNTHAKASMVMQVFPLFSSEEAYTNEEDPYVVTVMPGNNRYASIEWEKTPMVGIFDVKLALILDGKEIGTITKTVFVCPIWLLLIIFFVIFASVIYFVMKVKSRKKAAKRSENA